MDIAFIGRTAYVLVTLVGSESGALTRWASIASMVPPRHRDRGHRRVRLANPPQTAFFVPPGVQYAMQRYGRDFLVTDGHHNRVLLVTLDGDVSEFTPSATSSRRGWSFWAYRVDGAGGTGAAPSGKRQDRRLQFEFISGDDAGPAHRSSSTSNRPRPTGFALSQGHFTPGDPEGSPADPYRCARRVAAGWQLPCGGGG